MRFSPLQVLVFLVHFVAGSGILIALESIESMYLHSCVAAPTQASKEVRKGSLKGTKATPAYMPLPPEHKTCLALTTRKNSSGLSVTNVSQYRSSVLFQWWPHDADPEQGKCSVEFKGFQSEYRLSPDLGHYAGCSRDLSTHRHWLGQEQHARTKPAMDHGVNCPLTDLPDTYADYVQCELLPDTWYILSLSSSAFVEYQRHRNEIEHVTHEQTGFALFHTGLTVAPVGMDTWAKQLVNMHLGCIGCECDLLLYKHEQWTTDLYIDLYYTLDADQEQRERVGSTMLSETYPWRQMALSLPGAMGGNGSTSLCAQYSTANMTFEGTLQQHCTPVTVQITCGALGIGVQNNAFIGLVVAATLMLINN